MRSDNAIRQLAQALRRVELAKQVMKDAPPERANQLYERYRAEQEYLGRLLDAFLKGLLVDKLYPDDTNAAHMGC
ncbi:hypothetical protein [Alicyclobacillus macrosporangiidus]|uniref:Uncharacterized protein n=1 Tax=Alicyclobacillus macrosporangiidus TaxID=392015 RepID=A0A1I7LE89_9BACL|nr:hypothetical protein [Alicyclobacillus macrosporangiidus]SFV08009.1 hypothetical protein SAMN05421543_1412 [Alicyclobacillus macrosporangiidus]